jgi:hypothetical protein
MSEEGETAKIELTLPASSAGERLDRVLIPLLDGVGCTPSNPGQCAVTERRG